jgi:hypothetical protein
MITWSGKELLMINVLIFYLKILFMKRISLFALLAMVSSILYIRCTREGTINDCPSCNEEVTWSRYGKFNFSNSGFDGDIGNGVHLQSTCGWKIYNGNAGGYGHIYQVSSCQNGVIFTWAYGQLHSVALSNGWQGSTKEGMRIGDDLDKFLDLYPGFRPYAGDPASYSKNNVVATFSPDKKLTRLTVYNQ